MQKQATTPRSSTNAVSVASASGMDKNSRIMHHIMQRSCIDVFVAPIFQGLNGPSKTTIKHIVINFTTVYMRLWSILSTQDFIDQPLTETFS